MSTLRALLIGVNEYTHPRPCPAPHVSAGAPSPTPTPGFGPGNATALAEDANMPSAAIDVATIRQSFLDHAAKFGFAKVVGRTLTGAVNTTREKVLSSLSSLAGGASRGDQLVLYFSGHSWWLGHSLEPCDGEKRTKRWIEVALCPSDTTWRDVFISGNDVHRAADTALEQGACLEIILETCSAHALPSIGWSQQPFGGATIPQDYYARWDASGMKESSHSGPYPPCSDVDMQGLFTRFFCDRLIDPVSGRPTARRRLLDLVRRDLKNYQRQFRKCCENADPFAPEGAQTPELAPPSVLDRPILTGSCRGAKNTWESLEEIDWDGKVVTVGQSHE